MVNCAFCGAPYAKETAKFCKQCGKKRDMSAAGSSAPSSQATTTMPAPKKPASSAAPSSGGNAALPPLRPTSGGTSRKVTSAEHVRRTSTNNSGKNSLNNSTKTSPSVEPLGATSTLPAQENEADLSGVLQTTKKPSESRGGSASSLGPRKRASPTEELPSTSEHVNVDKKKEAEAEEPSSPTQLKTTLKNVQKVHELLCDAELEHYLQNFEKGRIDDTCLKYLSEEDLEKIGVSIGAHRKKLLELISEKFGGGSASNSFKKSSNSIGGSGGGGSFGGDVSNMNLTTLKPDGISPEMLQTENFEDFKGWKQGPLLGKGSYGAVYVGLLPSGKFHAVKKVELGGVNGIKPAELVVLSREITMMRRLRQQNVCCFDGCLFDPNENSILMFIEYVSGGSLSSVVKKFKPLPEALLQSYTIQLLRGLSYLHSQNIIHRDIKGDNVLVDMNPAVPSAAIKLADFGAAKRLNDAVGQSKTVVGTPYWMAPEVVMSSDGYDAKADIWSVGCTVAEMITGKPPWPSKANLPAAILMIAQATGGPTDIPTEGVSEKCRAFMDACFERDPAKRPSAVELLEHEWLAEHPLQQEQFS